MFNNTSQNILSNEDELSDKIVKEINCLSNGNLLIEYSSGIKADIIENNIIKPLVLPSKIEQFEYLFEDDNQRIWIKSNDNYLMYKNRKWIDFKDLANLNDNPISLIQDSNKKIWYISDNLYNFENDKSICFELPKLIKNKFGKNSVMLWLVAVKK